MQHMDLVAMAMPSTGAWGPMDLLLVFAMWAVMMVAMMVPSATPMLLAFATISCSRPQREGRSFPCGCSSRAIWYCGRLSASPPRWHSGDCTAYVKMATWQDPQLTSYLMTVSRLVAQIIEAEIKSRQGLC
jgi:predicted metal-binding membrane protein